MSRKVWIQCQAFCKLVLKKVRSYAVQVVFQVGNLLTMKSLQENADANESPSLFSEVGEGKSLLNLSKMICLTFNR